jgi:hypothetical protein
VLVFITISFLDIINYTFQEFAFIFFIVVLYTRVKQAHEQIVLARIVWGKKLVTDKHSSLLGPAIRDVERKKKFFCEMPPERRKKKFINRRKKEMKRMK